MKQTVRAWVRIRNGKPLEVMGCILIDLHRPAKSSLAFGASVSACTITYDDGKKGK